MFARDVALLCASMPLMRCSFRVRTMRGYYFLLALPSKTTTNRGDCRFTFAEVWKLLV